MYRTSMSFLFIFYFCYLILQVKGNLNRIVGGTKVPQEYGKYHASLQNLSGDHICGGAIISHRHLTTAAHCVHGATAEYIKVIVGTTNLDEGGLIYDVESIHIHKQYNRTLKLNDIAVLKIKGLFNLHYVEMIRLDEKEVTDGEWVILLGFGAREPYGESNRNMLGLNQTVFDQETCRYAMRYTREVYDSMFCTFTRKGEGTCHGDSGGPLTKDNKLVGIVSWGIPCGVGFPDVHTRITPYVTWIREIINETVSKYCRVPEI